MGGVGSYVLMENEHLRVCQNDLEPGESNDWRLHMTNYLFIATEHGDPQLQFEDGISRCYLERLSTRLVSTPVQSVG